MALALLLALTTVTSVASAGEARRFAPPPPAAIEPSAAAPRDFMAPQVLDRDTVRARLLANRRANLERFRAYQKLGVFPSNVYTKRTLNVWRDEDGHLCAAATLIQGSGNADLVARVAEQDNFIRLVDVTQGPVMDWILTSGLTQAELVAIQRPFMGVSKRPTPRPIEQARPAIVDARLRKAETARLARLYRRIEADLVAHQDASLELAVNRLMRHPALAATL
jgi:hypothetical protein